MKRVGTGVLLLCLMVACNAPGSVDEDVNKAPSVTNPGNQESRVGESVTLSIEATDPEGDALTFSASGLPSGLSIDAAGTVTGSPTQEESASVTVTVDDAKGNSPSVAFDWLIKEALPLAPPDFEVEADYSAAEPKLIVNVSDLETEALEKLEYRLERFSSDCFDAQDVKTDEVTVSGAAAEFDILTANYGAFKVSVTATYSATSFQNPVKTVLPLPSADDLLEWDLEDLSNPEGLVFVEVLDDFSAGKNVKQVFDFLDDTFDATVDLQAAENDLVVGIEYNLSGIETADRRWCDTSGLAFTVSSGNTEISEEASTAFNKPPPDSGPNTPYTFPVGPVEPLIVGDPSTRRLYTLYELTVDEFVEVGGDPEDLASFSQTLEFLVMDCESDELPDGIDCGDFNDVPR